MNKKSPLKDKPLRNPGQSLDEKIDYLINDKFLTYYFVTTALIIMAAVEWFRFYKPSQPKPWFYTAIALIAVALCAYKFIGIKKEVRNAKLGRDGERIVGEELEALREKGSRIFHDIVGDGFNVDHVVISEKGVYVVETKTWSKPTSTSKIYFDGESISIDQHNPNKDVLNQVKAEANWLKSVIKESTGKQIPVKPVIVFPGWFIETTASGKQSDVWVLNPKGLPTFIGNASQTLSREEMMLVSFHISRYIRTK